MQASFLPFHLVGARDLLSGLCFEIKIRIMAAPEAHGELNALVLIQGEYTTEERLAMPHLCLPQVLCGSHSPISSGELTEAQPWPTRPDSGRDSNQ